MKNYSRAPSYAKVLYWSLDARSENPDRALAQV